MTTPLTATSYRKTKEKLGRMEARLEALHTRTDLHPLRRAQVERSYQSMIRQYRRDLKLYEAANKEAGKDLH
jgi:hypothetical protein